ncbi:LAO/AO transport system ATPase [Saprolegnia diclina VS20]|uniref:LAO/AO transport system ATPase n=1 Tax=Saprolegnia diclina (strain VS20) TaxID=1156394 RepID=T0QN69_SAPDV|nr:LAO/AO transport system ATPase [Saprolegnia diclina VS20]EQC39509.1 LAO/AO transport system ATPase [Saprolegnia diclina VS20]|eukprot:XP_008606781.1 LAO/AO transport system ATPase [Saprolegnia diclina VS20]
MTALLPATKRLIDGLFHGASSAVARTSLARSITLVESTLPRDRFQAELLLDHVLEQRKALAASTTTSGTPHGHAASFRIGIAGPPGAGKSTFIETLGLSLTKKGHKVAVLAIDPSSSVTGGSILGDKTRMTHLSNSPDAFVRPSPTRGTLGGVAQHTNEIVLLCEACGYDIVLVESVGLGQSEIIIDDTVDMVMLLVPPAGGDELQGSKKGIMEIADVVVVNKADGELKTPAKHTAVDYMHALQLARRKEPEWKPTVKMCSAREGDGIDGVWDVLTEFRKTMNAVHKIEAKRARQSSKWMWNQLHQELMAMAKKNAYVKHEAATLAPDLAHGFISPRSAARKLLEDFLAHPKNK